MAVFEHPYLQHNLALSLLLHRGIARGTGSTYHVILNEPCS